MNKIIKVFSLLTFISIPLLLTGCGNSEEENGGATVGIAKENIKESTNEDVEQILKNFAQKYNFEESSIEEVEIEIKDSRPAEYRTLYVFWITWVKDNFNHMSFFDWWTYVYDFWLWWSDDVYVKNDIGCSYNKFWEQELPDYLEDKSLYEGYEGRESSMKRYNEKEKEFYDNLTYAIIIICWKLRETELLKFNNFYYNAQWWENSWTASIRWDTLYLITENDSESYYLGEIKPLLEENKIEFYGPYLKNWTLEKVPCKDGITWEEFDYKISFEVKDHDDMKYKYEWCAKEYHNEFTRREFWSLDSFIKKTWYEYTWDYNHDEVSYSVKEMINDYIHVYLYEWEWYGSQEHDIILQKEDNWWKIIYEWDLSPVFHWMHNIVEKYECSLTKDKDKSEYDKEKCKKFKDIEDNLDEALEFCNKYKEYDKNIIDMFFWKCIDIYAVEENNVWYFKSFM